MTAVAMPYPHAFMVRFSEMERWDVAFFRQVKWRWPESTVRPLGEALARHQVPVDAKADRTALPIIGKISFGGELTVTIPEERAGYKGRLFWAESGNLVYSKIRVKQGSLCIVPGEVPKLAVSAEYPVYEIARDVADADYIALVVRSTPFMNLLEGLSHGGSTKTRIPPEEFERQRIPLPPLSVQRKIVAAWDAARKATAATAAKIAQLEREIEVRFLADLGLKAPALTTLPKCFSVRWRDLLRWSVNYNQQAQAGMDLSRSKYPLASVGSVAVMIQYGTSEKANATGDGTPVIRMNNLVNGELDLRNLKHLRLSAADTARLTLMDGDILFNRTNSKELVGKCAVFHAQGKYVFASYLIRVRADTSRADPDFVAYALNCPIGRQQIDALSRQIIGQANVNSEELRSLQFPLPPLTVQRQIVERVAAGRAEIAKLKAAAKAAMEAAKADVEAMILGTKPVA